MFCYVSPTPVSPTMFYPLVTKPAFLPPLCPRVENRKPFSALFVFAKAFEYEAFIRDCEGYNCCCEGPNNACLFDPQGTNAAFDKVWYFDHHYHFLVRDAFSPSGWDYIIRFRCLLINDSDSGFSLKFGAVMGSWLDDVMDRETFLILLGSCGLTDYRCSSRDYAVNTILQIRRAIKFDRGEIIEAHRNFCVFSPREEKVSAATIYAPESLRLNRDRFPVKTAYSSNFLYLARELPSTLSKSTSSNHPIDMETYNFYEQCQMQGIRNFMAFRIISDINDTYYYSKAKGLNRVIVERLRQLRTSPYRPTRNEYGDRDLRQLRRLAQSRPADYEDILNQDPDMFKILRKFVRKTLLAFEEDFINSLMYKIAACSISLA